MAGDVPAVRVFIAVELPPDVRAALAGPVGEFQACCRAAGLTAGWSRPEGWHLTVKFLGAVRADRRHGVERALAETAARHQRFTLHLSGVGAFPSDRAPRTLWVGVADDDGRTALVALAREVEATMAPLGFLPEARPFSPHLTVARIKRPRSLPGLADLAARHGGRLATVDVEELVLMQSERREGGSVYTALAIAPLNPNHCHPSAKRL